MGGNHHRRHLFFPKLTASQTLLLFSLTIAALALAVSFLAHHAEGATCSSQANGGWDQAATWTACGGTFPQAADTAVVAHQITLESATAATVLTINDGYVDTTASDYSLTVSGQTTVGDAAGAANTAQLITHSSDLDLDGLAINNDGQVSAPDSTSTNGLHVGASFSNKGSYVHNNGQIVFDSSTNANYNYVSGVVATTFHDYEVASTGGIFRIRAANNPTLTIENAFTLTSGTIQVWCNDDPQTIVIGTASAAGTIANNAAFTFSANTVKQPTIQGASDQYPAVFTGNDWNWDGGGAGSTVNIKWLDYQQDATTGGAGVSIQMQGNVTFDDLTVSTGDLLNNPSHNATFVNLTVATGGNYTQGAGANSYYPTYTGGVYVEAGGIWNLTATAGNTTTADRLTNESTGTWDLTAVNCAGIVTENASLLNVNNNCAVSPAAVPYFTDDELTAWPGDPSFMWHDPDPPLRTGKAYSLKVYVLANSTAASDIAVTVHYYWTGWSASRPWASVSMANHLDGAFSWSIRRSTEGRLQFYFEATANHQNTTTIHRNVTWSDDISPSGGASGSGGSGGSGSSSSSTSSASAGRLLLVIFGAVILLSLLLLKSKAGGFKS